MVADSLCGSTPMITAVTPFLLASDINFRRRGGQRYFELSRPFFSHPNAAVPGQDARHE
jgi:hypothetical protein